MRTELMRLHRATGATSVYVTHDQIEAMTMATHVAVMNKGKVEQFGTPLELVENPQSAFVATFVGTPPANLIPYGASGVRACGKTISMMQVPEAAKTAAHAMFKAERLGITSESKANTLPMELAESSTIAGRTMVTALGGGLRLTAVIEGTFANGRAGDPVHMVIPETVDGWFDANGRRVA